MEQGKFHIAAIDDEFDVRELLQYNLTREGYSVATFSNPVQALEHFRRSRPDLILTDWLMPEMDGLEFCQRLQDIPETKGIPVIMITCKGNESDRNLAIQCGATEYFVKPFPIRDLVNRIKSVLKQPA